MAGYEYAGYQSQMTLFKSLNGGTSWQEYRPTSQSSYGYAVACVPGNSNIVFLGGIKGNDAVLYRTQDGGNSWESIGASTFSKDYKIHTIAIDPEMTNTIYVGASGGLYRSKDSGNTWEEIFYYPVYCIQFNTKNTQQIFIGGYWGVQTSKNGGDTWEDLSEGLTINEIYCLGIDSKSKWIYAGSYGGGIYKRRY